MGATVEALPSRSQALRSSALKKPLVLRLRDSRVLVDPDGAVRAFESLSERRALFGFEQLWFYKLQAGVIVQGQRPDWSLRVTPRSVQLSGRVTDTVEASQSIEFFRGSSTGYVRRLKLRNGGQSGVRLRVMELIDPTAAQLGDPHARWGSLGVNGFNRQSHVALDEVSDPPSARVVGALPAPGKIYMTGDRRRALELVTAGELPESTAGMSGQVLVLTSHDFELTPSEAKEFTFASIYNRTRLEDALTDFSKLGSVAGASVPKGPRFAAPSLALSDAAAWALSALEAAPNTKDALDRYECVGALAFVDPAAASAVVEGTRRLLRKDGSLPHSLDPSLPGPLETAVLLKSLATQLVYGQDKKLARSRYPMLKQMAGYLMAQSKEYAVRPSAALPQGWRRHLGTGFPAGEIPEVSLAVAGALMQASRVARMLGKQDEAGRFRERSEMVKDRVAKALVDDRGYVALCLDPSGKLRAEETADMAVAVYRHPASASADAGAAHRLLERDFETAYGPRCVPTSNRVYFNSSYGRGQLGGCWTRASLAHALVCYRSGLPGIGSLSLKKVAKLVTEDSVKLGGSPGEFPHWVDPEGGEAHGDDTDVVAAARFIEALIEGELGLSQTGDRPTFSPSASSGIGWLMAANVWAGEDVTAFLGRASGKAHLFFSATKAESRGGFRFAKSEPVEVSAKGVQGVGFHTPGQVVCLANSTQAAVRASVSFPPRAADLSKHLSVPLDVYEPAKGGWTKSGTVRVLPTMTFDADLGPEEWKAFRVSTA